MGVKEADSKRSFVEWQPIFEIIYESHPSRGTT